MLPRLQISLLVLRVGCILLAGRFAAAYDNGAPHSRLPPLGWSSWVALGRGWDTDQPRATEVDFCDEASVRSSIDAFFEVGLYAAGYRHFRLDDCWASKHRNASGHLQADLGRFPNGLPPLIEYAHQRGLTFGLYTCGGSHTCVGGRAGSKGHFEEDAEVLAEWGVDAVKMDWCYSQGMDPKETFAVMSHALNKTGRSMHFNMCEWGRDDPWQWGPSVAQSWRATGDHHGTWSSTKDIVAARTRLPEAMGGSAYAWNDLDLLQTGNYGQAGRPDHVAASMTETEYKSEFSMWAILGSPLIVSTPLLNCSSTDQIHGNFTPTRCRPSLTELQREILLNTEVLAISQESTLAGFRVSDPDPKEPSVSVYARNLTGGDVAVALLNAEDAELSGAVDFADLGLPKNVDMHVRDLWMHTDLGAFQDHFAPSRPLQAHETLLLRLMPQRTRSSQQASKAAGLDQPLQQAELASVALRLV
mmetsp:Transcript_18185/g.42525  ORF Transcript_18185/g.42525 Transcript_18185/m.42525 type:complete len:473 (+) Transcript_18185:167-1585(+)